ncbi:MAG: response regulator, partial [Myxococcota bacterium]
GLGRYPSAIVAHHEGEPLFLPAELHGAASRVLVVDDDATNRLVLSRLLARLGLEVERAEHGAQAVERALEAPFDLILMDCEMPVMDGFEATLKIREHLPGGPPIVACTAYSSLEDRARCLAVGMEEVLAKPLTRARLEAYLDARFDRGVSSSCSGGG